MTKAIQNHNINFTLFEHFPFPVLLVADTGLITYGNREALRLLGLPADDLTSRSWAGIDAQLTLFAWKKTWKSLKDTRHLSYETDLSTDGEFLRPIKVSAVLLDDNLSALFLEDKAPNLQQEAQLELLSKTSGLAYWSYNCLDNFWSCAPSLLKDLGLPEDNHLESYLKDDLKSILAVHLQQKSRAQLQQQFKNILVNGGSFELELLFKPGAKHKRMIINGVAISNGLHTVMINGTISPGFNQTTTDKEAALAKFSIDHANDLIFWARPDGHFAFANQSVGKKLQYTAEELEEMPIIQIAPYFDEEVRTAFWQRLREEQQFEEEFELTARDGSIITILASVNYFKIEGQELACSFCRDITVGKARQLRRKLSEFALDTSRDMILWVNSAGEIKYFNERFL